VEIFSLYFYGSYILVGRSFELGRHHLKFSGSFMMKVLSFYCGWKTTLNTERSLFSENTGKREILEFWLHLYFIITRLVFQSLCTKCKETSAIFWKIQAITLYRFLCSFGIIFIFLFPGIILHAFFKCRLTLNTFVCFIRCISIAAFIEILNSITGACHMIQILKLPSTHFARGVIIRQVWISQCGICPSAAL
jgi:hypothetical protein